MEASGENRSEVREPKTPFANHHPWDRAYHLIWLAAALAMARGTVSGGRLMASAR